MSNTPNNGQIFNGDVEDPSDRGLMVRFYMNAVERKKRSVAEGRPIFEDVLYINILVPGDRTMEVDRPATKADKDRFPRHWALFERTGSGDGIVGTPLKEWPRASVSMIKEWNALGIYSVENLAEMTDNNIGKILDGRKFRAEAQRWLQAAKEAAPIAQINEQLAQRDAQIELLQRQMAELLAGQPTDTKPAKAKAPA